MDYYFCRGKKLCIICRNRKQGHSFRKHLLSKKVVDREDFDCPDGKEWSNEAIVFPQATIKDFNSLKVAVQSKISKDRSYIKQRFEICKTCDQSRERGFKCGLHKGCCFGRWRGARKNKCPNGKW